MMGEEENGRRQSRLREKGYIRPVSFSPTGKVSGLNLSLQAKWGELTIGVLEEQVRYGTIARRDGFWPRRAITSSIPVFLIAKDFNAMQPLLNKTLA